MNKWYPEDWRFKIEVLIVGKEKKAEECRFGLMPGDSFACGYETPGGFCPTSFIKIFPVMEAIHCEGDLRYLGAEKPNEMDYMCPDGAVRFWTGAIKQE